MNVSRIGCTNAPRQERSSTKICPTTSISPIKNQPAYGISASERMDELQKLFVNMEKDNEEYTQEQYYQDLLSFAKNLQIKNNLWLL